MNQLHKQLNSTVVKTMNIKMKVDTNSALNDSGQRQHLEDADKRLWRLNY